MRLLLADARLRICVTTVLHADSCNLDWLPTGRLSFSRAVYKIRLVTCAGAPHRTISQESVLSMPLEMKNADNVDFEHNKENKLLDELGLLPITAEKPKTDNVFMNEAKTEFTHVLLPDMNNISKNGGRAQLWAHCSAVPPTYCCPLYNGKHVLPVLLGTEDSW